MRFSILYLRSSRGYRRLSAFIGGLLLLCGSAFPAERSISRPVAQGVILRQILREPPGAPALITVLDVNLKQSGVRAGVELGQDDVENDGPTDGREAISTLARRKGVAAAVNGDYFIGGAPVGLCIHNGEVITLPLINRTVCAFLSDHRVVFDVPKTAATVKLLRSGDSSASLTFPLASLNRKRGSDSLVLYTPAYGPKTLTNAFGTEVVVANLALPLKPGRWPGVVKEIRPNAGGTPLRSGEVVLSGHGIGAAFLKRLQPGDSVEITLSIQSPRIPDWRSVRDAVGGGPTLVRDGQVFIDAQAQKFQPDVALGSSPRTAVGLTKDGHLLIVAVDGRQPLSAGMTLTELAEFMRRLGCVSAMNLDGGGSTTMAVQGVRVNSPSDGWERSVAEALAIRAPALTSPSRPFGLVAELDGPLGSGQSVPFEIRDEEGEPITGDLPIVWGIEGPIGFVDQSGRFIAGKVGKGRVVARWGDQMATAEIQVVPGKTVAKLMAAWSLSNTSRALASEIRVKALDSYGNAISGVQVEVELPTGASADALSRPTDASGAAVFQITWPPTGPRRLTVKSGAMLLTPPDAPLSSPLIGLSR